LRHFGAGELLAVLGENGHTGTLRAEADTRVIEIVFRDRKVIWARSGEAATREAVLDLFTWPGGTFSFTEEVTLPAQAATVSLETRALIEDGTRYAEAYRRTRKLYPDESAIVRPIDSPAGQENISLTPDALKVLLRVAGGRSLKQLCSDLGRDSGEVYALVNSLERAGLVQIEAQSGTTAEMTPIVLTPQGTSPIASLTGGTTGEVWPLLEDEYSLGRIESNAIVVNDSTVSSKHARIFRSGDGFYLEDLQSRNGTFVNGDRVTEKRLLADHDVIRFGRVVLTFNIASEMIPTATSAGTIRI